MFNKEDVIAFGSSPSRATPILDSRLTTTHLMSSRLMESLQSLRNPSTRSKYLPVSYMHRIVESYIYSSSIFEQGQRYSLILHANQSISNYWIRANPDLNPLRDQFQGGVNSAILRYDGAPDQEPTTSATANPIVMNEADLHVRQGKLHILPIDSNPRCFARSLSSILER